MDAEKGVVKTANTLRYKRIENIIHSQTQSVEQNEIELKPHQTQSRKRENDRNSSFQKSNKLRKNLATLGERNRKGNGKYRSTS